MEYDRSRLNAEIEEMEARRAAEARAREAAAEREARGPAYRGVLRRIRAGIKAGRAEARELREARAQPYREYDEAHPSDLGRKVGRVVERTRPATDAIAKAAAAAARKTRQTSRKALQEMAKAAREQQRRQREQQRRLNAQQPAPARRGKSRKTQRAAPLLPPPPPARRPVNPLAGLDDMLIQPGPNRQKKKGGSKRRDDPFGLKGFRLM